VDGDAIVLGPPFVVTDEELVRIGDVLGEAIEAAGAAVAGDPTSAAAGTA
jgi:adenosylmethionine-8-amino-7-oxononanoate aminotransferase